MFTDYFKRAQKEELEIQHEQWTVFITPRLEAKLQQHCYYISDPAGHEWTISLSSCSSCLLPTGTTQNKVTHTVTEERRK